MEKSKSKMFALVGAAAVVVIAVVGFSVWATGSGRDETPSPNGDPATIAKFLTTTRWTKMDESQRRPYMKTLRKGSDEISKLLASGKISKEEHDLAKQNIWLERQFDRMDEYYKLPPGAARVKYLDDLVQHKVEKRKHPEPRDPNDPPTGDSTPWAKARKEQWLQAMEQRWDEYRDALDAREKAHGIN
jgi:hypothetical protein